jgi:hypothetical protein
MNEIFAADPLVCESARDLKALLDKFGPFTGRYLARYPIHWMNLVEERFDSLGEIEIARVKALLRRAKENLTLIESRGLSWSSGDRNWLENASSQLAKADKRVAGFDGLIAIEAKPPLINTIDSLDLPPTSEERITGKAEEYARIADRLLTLSPRIGLIDPYLNPLSQKCERVIKALFKKIAEGRCEEVIIWARESEVIGSKTLNFIKSDLENKLHHLAKAAQFKPKRKIQMRLMSDETSRRKMHARYILSNHGGIRLDQGFQELAEGRYVDVGPIGKQTHEDLLKSYFEDSHDMPTSLQIEIRI